MPELPEVQTVVNDLQSLNGFVIKTAKFPREQLKKHWIGQQVLGQKLLSISRRGKYIIMNFQPGVLAIHLGMSGRLVFKEIKHTRASFEFVHYNKGLVTKQIVCYFDDIRCFGRLYTYDNALVYHQAFDIGPDVYEIDAEDFVKRLRLRNNQSIKCALLDQSIISGYGNIYAAEACFMTGVDPATKVVNCSDEILQILYRLSSSMFDTAIALRGTTFDAYRGVDGQPGLALNALYVYGKTRCICCGSPINKIKQEGRTTWYCPTCQAGDCHAS